MNQHVWKLCSRLCCSLFWWLPSQWQFLWRSRQRYLSTAIKNHFHKYFRTFIFTKPPLPWLRVFPEKRNTDFECFFGHLKAIFDPFQTSTRFLFKLKVCTIQTTCKGSLNYCNRDLCSTAFPFSLSYFIMLNMTMVVLDGCNKQTNTVWPLSSLPIMQNIVTCKGPPSMQRQRWKSFVLMLHQIFQDLNCLIWLKLSHFRLVLQCLWHSPSHKAGDAIFIALYCHRSNKVSCCVLKPFFWSQFFYLLQERGI